MNYRELVLQFIQANTHTYWNNYLYYVEYVRAREVASMSFKHKPSLTYLDLYCDTLSTVTKLPTRLESWRSYMDIRKEIIYRLDLEDKYQWTQCSAFCYQSQNFPLRKQWTLDYDGFPGYIRLHDVVKPKECAFGTMSSLEDYIIDFVSESSVVEAVILLFLPSIKLLHGWISITDILRIYASFLTILYENRSNDIALIDTLLEYSKQLCFWRELELEVVAWLLLTSQNMNLSSSQWFYKGTCGLTLELIMCNPSMFKAFLQHGLHPLMEDAITIDRTSNDAIEKEFINSYDSFIQCCLPEGLFERKRDSISTKMTNIDLLCLIAVGAYKMVKDSEFREALVMTWRSISNAYLVFEDFEQLFEELSGAERQRLKYIYVWYRKAVNADICHDRSPRTLKQYCRCAIRKRLVETSKLQSGIEKLPLSEELKSFLKLEY